MQAFMRNVKSKNNSREMEIKTSIMTQLSESLKDIQLCSIEEGDSQEARNTLCSTIEALFLHGLKDSLTHRFRRALADLDQPPQPNFWSPLSVISHREIIDQINGFSQIVTEIGQCRAWIRLALNESLLSSYLMIIGQDPGALKPYYNTYAYIRDLDLLYVAQRLIEGVETIKLDLPCNSSLLNNWPIPTLLLAGIWSPTLRSCPIASGIDVAQSIHTTTSSVNSETCSIASMVSQNSGIGQVLALNQDEALKIILAKHSDKDEPPAVPAVVKPREEPTVTESVASTNIEQNNIQTNMLGNSLNGQSGWSFDENNEDVKENVESDVQDNTKSMEHSYNALIESSYNMLAGSHIRTPDFREIWQKLEASNGNFKSESPSKTVRDILPPRQQPLALAAQVTIISKEKGLDSQDYECSTCKEVLNLSSKPVMCEFTGEYFCDTCMAPETIHIPARIIHNWDFNKYLVSQKAFNCLEEIKDHPIIDFKVVNPYIYTVVEEMGRLQILRNQLNYLRAYLYTCREPIIEQLQKQMWPREYMYEHIHQYAISDLLQIKDGTLAQQLEKVVQFGTEHVLNCWLCSQKGFLCEICKKSKALFPFDTENVYRCNLCSGIYHKSCLNASKPCPRCERKKKRDDLPLLDVMLD